MMLTVNSQHGTGRKAAWWSPILLACYNAESGQLEAVTKCMAGELPWTFLFLRLTDDSPLTGQESSAHSLGSSIHL